MTWGLFDLVSGGAGDGDSGGRGRYGRIDRFTVDSLAVGGPGTWSAWTELYGVQDVDTVITGMYVNATGATIQLGYGPNSGAVTQRGAASISAGPSSSYTVSPTLIPKGQRAWARGMNPGGAGAAYCLGYMVRRPPSALRKACRWALVSNVSVWNQARPSPIAPTWGAWVEIADAALLPAGKRWKVINGWDRLNLDAAFTVQYGLGDAGSQTPVVTVESGDLSSSAYAPGMELWVDALAGSRQSGVQIPGGQRVWMRSQNPTTAHPDVTQGNPIFVEA